MPTTVTAALQVRNGGSRVAHAVTRNGRAYSLGMTPETATLDGLAMTVEQIKRPGLTPLSRLSAPQLRTLTFNHQVIRNTANITAALASVARNGWEVRFVALSSLETGVWWRITGLSINVTERLADQTPKTATVTWTLVESVDVRPKIGKTPPPGGMFSGDLAPSSSLTPGGGGSPLPAPGTSGTPGGPGGPPAATPAPVARHYVVRANQTLYSIASALWSNGYLWPYLANANKGKLKFAAGAFTRPPIAPPNTSGTPAPPGPPVISTTPTPTQYRVLTPGLVLDVPRLPDGT